MKRTSKGLRCLQLIFYWLKPPLIVTVDWSSVDCYQLHRNSVWVSPMRAPIQPRIRRYKRVYNKRNIYFVGYDHWFIILACSTFIIVWLAVHDRAQAAHGGTVIITDTTRKESCVFRCNCVFEVFLTCNYVLLRSFAIATIVIIAILVITV